MVDDATGDHGLPCPRGSPAGAADPGERRTGGVSRQRALTLNFDGQIELEALRLYGLPEAAPALIGGVPALPADTRGFQAEVSWDLPSLAPGITSLLDVTVARCRVGDLADSALTPDSPNLTRRPGRPTPPG